MPPKIPLTENSRNSSLNNKGESMSQITIGTVAYVPNTPDSILDDMVCLLSYSATGEGLVVVDIDTVQEYVSNNEIFSGLRTYLKESLANINSLSSTPVGVIFFTS
jgi:hypothetical protein